jgi:hypothetical protein
MPTPERRLRRGTTVSQSLRYQLAACREEGELAAMVVADADGLLLAAAGDAYACDEVAARAVIAGRRIGELSCALLGAGHQWDVQLRRVDVDGSELVVCAVGGTAEARAHQLARGAAGAARILASA